MSRKLLTLSVTAALMGGTAMAETPRVAVDITPVHSLVARVMEGVGTPDLIVQQGASPHGYSLRPSEADALQSADVVIWMGADLSPWMEGAVDTLAEEASVLTLLEADGTTLLEFREGALFEAHSHDHGDEDHEDHAHDDHADHDHGHEDEHAHDDHDHDHDHAHDEEHAHADHDHAHDEEHAHDDHAHAHEDEHAHDDHDHAHDEEHAHDDHDHAHEDEHAHDDHDHAHDEEHAHDDHAHDHDDHAGHDHGEYDPHAWLSPTNAATWLNLIAAELSAVDPDNAGAYFANAAAARAEMEALSAEVSDILEPARGMNFIVFHDAYQYFEMDFDFPASGAISLGDASDPSPARVAEIQGRVRDEGIDCVLSEPQFNPGLVATVLDGTDATTTVIDPLGFDLDLGPTLYPQLIRNLATSLAECG